jgi:hypothetical protein
MIGISTSLISFSGSSTRTTILDVLGSRLYRWYLNYDSTGTYTCQVGSGNGVALNPGGTAANIPAVATTALGQSYPDFDGQTLPNQDCIQSNIITTLPAYVGTDHFIWGALIRCDGTADAEWLYGVDDYNCYIDAGGIVNFAGALSDATVIGAGWFSLIVVKNGSSGVVTQYINTVAQSSTGTGTLGSDWKISTAQFLGVRSGGTDFPFNGGMISPFWGRSTSAFTTADVTALSAVLFNT